MSPIHGADRRTILIIRAAVFAAACGYGTTFALLAARLHESGVTGLMIGLNAAMPPLGWILASIVSPALQTRFGIKRVVLGYLSIGIVALAALAVAETYTSNTILRLFFGGGVGMFFRSIEYWINGISANSHRGRDFATYALIYNIGLILGSVAIPSLPLSGSDVFWPGIGALVLAALVIGLTRGLVQPDYADAPRSSLAAIAVLPAAFAAILAYGLFEDIPVYLTSIYAARNGLGADVAAYTVTAAALGNLLLPLPILMLSDRIGRMGPLIACATIVAALSALLPFVLWNPNLFLAVLVVWGGSAGAIYSLVLAILGDKLRGAALIAGNATFGMVYAGGALVGPIINGAAIDTLNSHGVMVSAGTIFGVLIIVLAVSSMRSSMRLAHER